MLANVAMERAWDGLFNWDRYSDIDFCHFISIHRKSEVSLSFFPTFQVQLEGTNHVGRHRAFRDVVALNAHCPPADALAVRDERVLHPGGYQEVIEALRGRYA